MVTAEQFMAQCLADAARGQMAVAPNPMVGACLVHRGKIIGSGIHQYCGGPHAEVNAINQVADQGLLRDSTLYVTLEPCSHYGKTPPCADLVISSGIRSVVIATRDPNPKVAGNGIRKLREQGITVTENVLAEQARLLNRRFFTAHLLRRPYIILKWAQSADGFIARSDGSSKWISGEDARDLVHTWRAEEQAILVGARTAHIDNPRLTVRNNAGKNPVRVVFDRDHSLPATLNLWNNEAPTLCFSLTSRAPHAREEVVVIDGNQEVMPQILKELVNRDIQSLFVEGGAETFNQMIQQDLWDEARIFTAQGALQSGILAPQRRSLTISKDPLLVAKAGPFKNDVLEFVFNQQLERVVRGVR